MTERDTKFMGFARLLLAELVAQRDGMWLDLIAWDDELIAESKQLIARRAYDLVSFASECINDKQLEEGMRLTPAYMIECIPDLTEWPPR